MAIQAWASRARDLTSRVPRQPTDILLIAYIYLILSGCAEEAQLKNPPPDRLQNQIVSTPPTSSWLHRHHNQPLFIAGAGDPEDFLYRGKRRADGTRDGDQDQIIAKLARTGANGIYFQIIRSHGGDGNETHNPFIHHRPENGLNEQILEQWETWLTALEAADVTVLLSFYDDADIWDTGDTVEEAEQRFIHAIVDRFEHHGNIIWAVAEEYQEEFTRDRVSRIAAEIRAADDYDHPIAVHKLIGTSFSEFANDPNIDQFAVQLKELTPTELHRTVLKLWRNAGGRYNINVSEMVDWGSGELARKRAWAAAMGGAYVMGFGMNVVDTPEQDLRDLGRLRSFLEGAGNHRLVPRDDLAEDPSTWVLAAPGDAYVLYTIDDSKTTIGLRSIPNGQYDLKWLDTATGKKLTQETQTVTNGTARWNVPDFIGPEVALRVVRRETSHQYVFPQDSWQWRSPTEAGLHEVKLMSIEKAVGGDGCVIRHGYMVHCWGRPGKHGDWASAAKPLHTTLLFHGIATERVESLNAPIGDYWRWLDWLQLRLVDDHRITFGQLANMISGYARAEGPGEAYAYNDYAIQLYVKSLEKAFGQGLNAVADKLFAPLQLEDGKLFGSRDGYGVNASVRDICRIGLLWLNHGRWEEKQLIPRFYFDYYAHAWLPYEFPVSDKGTGDYLDVGSFGGGSNLLNYGPGAYGFTWWFNLPHPEAPASLSWPAAPADMYLAAGHAGKESIIVIPSWDMVVAWRSDRDWESRDLRPFDPDSRINQVLSFLKAAYEGG